MCLPPTRKAKLPVRLQNSMSPSVFGDGCLVIPVYVSYFLKDQFNQMISVIIAKVPLVSSVGPIEKTPDVEKNYR